MAVQVRAEIGAVNAEDALAAARTVAWHWVIGSPAIAWSPRAAQVLGVPEIVLRSPDLILEALDPDDLALASAASESWKEGTPVRVQLRARLAGKARWFDVAGRVVQDPFGSAPHFATGTVRDVTEDREAQDALLQALHDAEELVGLDRVVEQACRRGCGGRRRQPNVNPG